MKYKTTQKSFYELKNKVLRRKIPARSTNIKKGGTKFGRNQTSIVNDKIMTSQQFAKV